MARHLLITAGTTKYNNLAPEHQRPQLVGVIDSIADLFINSLSYERELESISLNTPSDELRKSLDRWFAAAERDPSDWVVVYYTGHGELVGNDSLYLLTSDFEEGLYAGTAFHVRELASMVLAKRSQTEPRQVKNLLVIIDACYAGSGTLQLAANLAERFRLTSQSMFYVLGAALPRQEAKAGALAQALIASIEDLSNRYATQELLYLDQILPAINSRLRVHEAVLSSVTASREEPRFFPNPNFINTMGRPIAASDGRRAMVDPHFRARIASVARNAVFDSQPGLLFAGRIAVLNKLKHFLAASDRSGTRVVTGGPGAGKSAILGRILGLSAPANERVIGHEENRFPPFDLALQAKGRTFVEVTSQLAALVKSAPAPEAIFGSLKSSLKSIRIIVDSLNEAAQPFLIADRLLRPISAIPSVKLIVGTQTTYARALDAAEVIDIDTPEHASQKDIAEYVEALLLRAAQPDVPTPYAGEERNARRVAEIVADKAYPNFLVARLIAEDLLSRSRPIGPDEASAMTLPSTVSAAFDSYLARFGHNEARARDLLLPLAYAEGHGLPWDNIWAPLASRLAGRSYQDADVQWLLEHAVSFVLESTENGHSVFRLFHSALAESLREGRDSPIVQSGFVAALTDSVPLHAGSRRPHWSLANRYVRSHLATHAASAGKLDSLLTDPLFLVAADEDRLLLRLNYATSISAQEAAKAYLRAAYYFRDASDAQRLAYLELAAHQCGIADFIKPSEGISESYPWRVSWACWSSAGFSRIVAQHADYVRAVMLVKANDQQFIVSASSDGVRVTPLTGTLLWERAEFPVTSLAMGMVGGRHVVVAGCRDGNVRLWDLFEGSPVGNTFGGHTGEDADVRAVRMGRLDGRALLVSGGNDGTVRFWDIERQEPLCDPMQAFTEFIQDIAVGTINGRLVLIGAATDPNVLRLWDLRDRSLLRQITAQDIGCGWIRALSIGVQNGRSVIVIATDGGGVRVVDPESGSSELLPLSTRIVDAVAISEFNGNPIVVADSTGPIAAWDLEQKRLIGRLSGHHDTITALTLGVVGDRTILISGSLDKTVRVWDFDNALKPEASFAWMDSKSRPQPLITAICRVGVGPQDGRSIVVCSCIGPQLHVRDLASGELFSILPVPRWDIFDDDSFPVADFAFAVGSNEGRTLIALGGIKESLIWEIVELKTCDGRDGMTLADERARQQETQTSIYTGDTRLRQSQMLHEGDPVTALAFGQWNGGEVLAVAHVSSQIRLWNLRDRVLAAEPLELNGISRSLALAACPGCSLLAAKVQDTIQVSYLDGVTTNRVMKPKTLITTDALAAHVIDGQPVVVCGGFNGFVYVSNPRTGEEKTFQTYDQTVRAVIITVVDGVPVIISGGDDGFLCVSSMNGSNLIRVHVDAMITDVAAAHGGEILVGTSNGLLALRLNLNGVVVEG